MLGYVASVSHPQLGTEVFASIVYHPGSRKDVEQQVLNEGWKVHRVRAATLDDVSELPTIGDLLITVNVEIARKRKQEFEERRKTELAKRQRDEQRDRAVATAQLTTEGRKHTQPLTTVDYATPAPPSLAAVQMPASRQKKDYKVLSQKDKWFSQKFDPSLLEAALNSYASQGWSICAADTASFPGAFTGHRQELIAVLERGGENTMFEYKVLTQKDKWFSGKFDPQLLEAAINAYAQQGWQVVVDDQCTVPCSTAFCLWREPFPTLVFWGK